MCKVFTRWFGSPKELKHNAVVAQLVEHHLAKVDVASSSLVNRSQHSLRVSSAIGAAVAHFLDMEGVTGSIPVSRTG